jgi:peptidyl-tRNA hydrolase, PTH1 family
MAWVVAGIGNPDEAYAMTRHNVGRMTVAFLARTLQVDFRTDKKANALSAGLLVGKEAAALVLPNTYMNKSGLAISRFVKSVKAAERLIVVHDDLDLPLGSLKISFDRGSAGHKGLESIMKTLKTKKFIRLRIGISPATAAGVLRRPKSSDIEKFVLGNFTASERAALKSLMKRAVVAIQEIVTHGREQAMNEFNTTG